MPASSGSVFSPELPRPLVLASKWAFGAILLLAVFQLAIDLSSLALSAVRSGTATPATLRYAAAGLAAVLAAVGVAQAARVPPVRELTVEVAGLPPAFDGYRLIQLTDLHISRLFQQDWARAVVRKTNALDADLIVVTGDGTVAARRRDVAPLRDLAEPDGVWLVPGNHEYFFGNAEWMRHLLAFGLRPLVNAHTLLGRGGNRLVLAGVTDLSDPDTGDEPPDLDAALAKAPAGVPVILLDHQPKTRARRRAAASRSSYRATRTVA